MSIALSVRRAIRIQWATLVCAALSSADRHSFVGQVTQQHAAIQNMYHHVLPVAIRLLYLHSVNAADRACARLGNTVGPKNTATIIAILASTCTHPRRHPRLHQLHLHQRNQSGIVPSTMRRTWPQILFRIYGGQRISAGTATAALCLLGCG